MDVGHVEICEFVEPLEDLALALQRRRRVRLRNDATKDAIGNDFHGADDVLDGVDVGAMKDAALAEGALNVVGEVGEHLESLALSVERVKGGDERRE